MTPDLICVLDSDIGRSSRQRDDPLRSAGHGDRPAAAGDLPVARRAWSMSARAPSATTSSSRACSREPARPLRSTTSNRWPSAPGCSAPAAAAIPISPLLNMRALYAEGHRVQLMDAADLADDDWVGAVANMGAPLVGQERLTDSRTLARAVSADGGAYRQALPRAHEHRDRRRQRRPAADGGGASRSARWSTPTRWAAPIPRRR